MGFKVVIPARYQSSRFPGKPLARLAGRAMIEHVHERAVESGAELVVVATDDHRIREACEQFGARVCMTAGDHGSGTDRVAEAADQLGWADEDIVVNLQGDEPLMPGESISSLAELMEEASSADLATLCTRLSDAAEYHDANVCKVVRSRNGAALYFSRAPIPWERDSDGDNIRGVWRHIGLYAYRVGVLKRLASEPPCELEELERLEQLRALWLGLRIQVGEVDSLPGPGVDTPADLERVEARLPARWK